MLDCVWLRVGETEVCSDLYGLRQATAVCGTLLSKGAPPRLPLVLWQRHLETYHKMRKLLQCSMN